MSNIPAHFKLPFTPKANPQAYVIGPNVRFTVLTSQLIRLEYSPTNTFEDRASQVFWYRQQPVPNFQVIISKTNTMEIITNHLHLKYTPQADGFSADTLSITLRQTDVTWHYGDDESGNLAGTARTLDNVSGNTTLEPGLLSKDGWVVVDDSKRLVFNEQCWLEPRQTSTDNKDLYFFGYGQDYQGCLRDYSRVAGTVPLIPRWALGNWWSRYWAYTQTELTQLMRDFKANEVPLAVCIVDMDWHIVDTTPWGGYSGWTGYTWNKDLFPNPEKFIAWLHQKGLKTALNLHPADGIRQHEAMYAEMADRLGVDSNTKDPIPFDIANLDFTKAYFEILHHPQEEKGVDFWWIDWQQGELSALPGLDPLWWLNHLHFYDLSRPSTTDKTTAKRPFVFSRWGGLGNHRYPIGFSGDTIVNWESLAFQPYFTATAANVGYSWWSHDIGGHMQGIEDAELYTRWVQYGVFSPIFRLHCTNNAFHERRPWGYDAHTLNITREAMQLRHALIPYLYTMAWRNHTEFMAPIRPMYHNYSEFEAAYHCPQQYTFGSELIVAPYTTPANPETGLSRQVIWLPPGDWYNFFTGQHYAGDAWYALYGGLSDIPVFAKAGAIIPLAPKVGWGGLEPPEYLDIHIFAGADNRFDLYEDDGETTAYQQGHYHLTRIEQKWSDTQITINIAPIPGHGNPLLTQRVYRIHCHGLKKITELTLTIDNESTPCQISYNQATETLITKALAISSNQTLILQINSSDKQPLTSKRNRTQETCLNMLWSFHLESIAKSTIANRLAEILANPTLLADFTVDLTNAQLQALLEVSQQIGCHHIPHTRHKDLLLLWNNQQKENSTYQWTQLNPNKWRANERFNSTQGPIPRFKVIIPSSDNWRLLTTYFGLLSVELLSSLLPPHPSP